MCSYIIPVSVFQRHILNPGLTHVPYLPTMSHIPVMFPVAVLTVIHMTASLSRPHPDTPLFSGIHLSFYNEKVEAFRVMPLFTVFPPLSVVLM